MNGTKRNHKRTLMKPKVKNGIISYDGNNPNFKIFKLSLIDGNPNTTPHLNLIALNNASSF